FCNRHTVDAQSKVEAIRRRIDLQVASVADRHRGPPSKESLLLDVATSENSLGALRPPPAWGRRLGRNRRTRLVTSPLVGERATLVPMKTRAAVAYEAGKPLVIEEVELEGPKAGEVMVEIKATGVCHTDEFTRSGADR